MSKKYRTLNLLSWVTSIGSIFY